MGIFYCNAFNVDKTTLKSINDVLTTPDKEALNGKTITSTCGGFLLDDTVFKIDKKTGAITKKEAGQVKETITPYCGGIKLDASVFEVNKKGIVSLKQVPVVLKATNQEMPTTNITFDSLEQFEVILKDENGKVIEPISEKSYVVPKDKNYIYEATNGEKTVTKEISTKRRVNIIETITF